MDHKQMMELWTFSEQLKYILGAIENFERGKKYTKCTVTVPINSKKQVSGTGIAILSELDTDDRNVGDDVAKVRAYKAIILRATTEACRSSWEEMPKGWTKGRIDRFLKLQSKVCKLNGENGNKSHKSVYNGIAPITHTK